jgi:hypothetical protein
VTPVPPDGADGEFELQPTAKPISPARIPNRNFIFISIRRDQRKGVATFARARIGVICEQNPDPQRFLCFRKLNSFLSA